MPKPRGFCFALLLAVAVALSLALSMVRTRHVVPQASFAALAEHVRARYRPGDLIVVVPDYVDGPRLLLGDLPLIERRELTERDLRRYARIHLVQLRVIGASEQPAALVAQLGRRLERRDWPQAEVDTYELARHDELLADLWRDLPRATVTKLDAKGGQHACSTWAGGAGRWLCPAAAEWNYVGREVRELARTPWPCVWLHPPEPGSSMLVQLPVGAHENPARRAVELELAFVGAAAEHAHAPAEVRLRSDAAELWHGRHAVHAGLEEVRLSLPEEAQALTLAVSSADNAVGHLCVNLRVVEPSP
jgi:hypothetical protein